MRVYALVDWFYYEGEDFKGVFLSAEEAMKEALIPPEQWKYRDRCAKGAAGCWYHDSGRSYGSNIFVYDLEAP